jgi:hypothetical protein
VSRRLIIKSEWEETGFGNLVKHTIIKCSQCKKILLSFYESGPAVEVASNNDCEHFYVFTWSSAAESEYENEFREDQRKAKYILQTNNGLLMILPRGE